MSETINLSKDDGLRQTRGDSDAILRGFPPEKLKDKAEKLEARKVELAELLANVDEPPPLLHPNMAHVYQDRVGKLCENLQREEDRAPAVEALRSPIEQVTLMPDNVLAREQNAV